MSLFSDIFYQVTDELDFTNRNAGIRKVKLNEAALVAASMGFPTVAAAIVAGKIVIDLTE